VVYLIVSRSLDRAAEQAAITANEQELQAIDAATQGS
jgi:hypothetical protein